jgi:hypothetical protein
MGGGRDMAKNDMLTKIGSWAFLIGILIAVIFGLYYAYTIEAADVLPFFTTESGGAVAWVLAVIGAIIGILTIYGKGTITRKEVPGFLFAGIALVVMGAVFNTALVMGLTPWIGSLLHGVSFTLSIFVAPTVGLLAIKAIWDMGKDV